MSSSKPNIIGIVDAAWGKAGEGSESGEGQQKTRTGKEKGGNQPRSEENQPTFKSKAKKPSGKAADKVTAPSKPKPKPSTPIPGGRRP